MLPGKNGLFFSQTSKIIMDYRQLKCFIAVFEERNITSAARRMFLTQPALSATIKALEQELEVALFDRLPRGVEVTADARVLYPQARRMVAEADALARSFRKEQNRQQVVIGIESDIATSQVEQVLRAVQQKEYPLLITLEPDCTGEIRFGSEDQRCEDELFLPLFTEPYVLALADDHPLGRSEQLTAADLQDIDWIQCPGHDSHQRLLPLYGARAASPAANAGNLTLALHLVQSGMGAAIVPESLAQARCNVITRALPEQPLVRRTGICYAVQTQAIPSVAWLLEHLRQVFAG